jgi:hypothetical protein
MGQGLKRIEAGGGKSGSVISGEIFGPRKVMTDGARMSAFGGGREGTNSER